jgi:hypothetical protein
VSATADEDGAEASTPALRQRGRGPERSGSRRSTRGPWSTRPHQRDAPQHGRGPGHRRYGAGDGPRRGRPPDGAAGADLAREEGVERGLPQRPSLPERGRAPEPSSVDGYTSIVQIRRIREPS